MPYDELMDNARAVPAALGETMGRAFFLGKAIYSWDPSSSWTTSRT
jgi:hypothetical protein